MATNLRPAATVIDDETERAVAKWVRLGDQVTGKAGGERVSCSRCGSRDRVLDRGNDHALCARCYLERGAPSDM